MMITWLVAMDFVSVGVIGFGGIQEISIVGQHDWKSSLSGVLKTWSLGSFTIQLELELIQQFAIWVSLLRCTPDVCVRFYLSCYIGQG